jgi:hypothetical protein
MYIEQVMGFVKNNKSRKANNGMEWTRCNRKTKENVKKRFLREGNSLIVNAKRFVF